MKTFCDDLQSAANLGNIWSLLIRLEKAVCCVYKFNDLSKGGRVVNGTGL